MKATIWKYGVIGGLFMAIAFAVSVPLSGSPPDYGVMEIYGYASMVVAALLIVVAVREYRNRRPAGTLRVGEGLMVGIGVAAITALVVGLYTAAHIAWIDPDFGTQYVAWEVERVRTSGASAADVAKLQTELNDMLPSLNSPFAQGGIIFASSFLIGCVVALAASVLLKRRETPSTSDVSATRGVPM